ncbi:hypothetical protein RND81_01G223500 [Saponaria officinalis]|uniref:Uncharacterized protein n=1 Tax=Saponaria officinalis TaxID=3572 RepID=A0AAW1NBS6_SAPOF
MGFAHMQAVIEASATTMKRTIQSLPFASSFSHALCILPHLVFSFVVSSSVSSSSSSSTTRAPLPPPSPPTSPTPTSTSTSTTASSSTPTSTTSTPSPRKATTASTSTATTTSSTTATSMLPTLLVLNDNSGVIQGGVINDTNRRIGVTENMMILEINHGST